MGLPRSTFYDARTIEADDVEIIARISAIKGLLMTQGIRDFQATRRDWADRLERLRTGDGCPLPPALTRAVQFSSGHRI